MTPKGGLERVQSPFPGSIERRSLPAFWSRVFTRAWRMSADSKSSNWLCAARATLAAVSPVESETMWISRVSDTGQMVNHAGGRLAP